MALIDFECTKCEKKFFEIVNPSDADSVKCPDCGSDVKRVYKGRFYGKASEGGSSSKGCSGSCSCCSGCH